MEQPCIETAPRLLKADVNPFVYQERSTAGTKDGLSVLAYGVYKILPGAASGRLAHLDEEALLFMDLIFV